MAERNWDAVIITGTDPHCSEYPAARWKQVEWLSGFTGEAGDIVVTADHAGLWTDTRYFIQALEQLQGSGVVLHKMKVPGAVGIPEWLAGKFPDGAVIAVDGLCQSYEAVGDLPGRVVDVPDLPSLLWEGRPDIPCTPVTTLGEEQVGVSRADKLRRLRKCPQIIVATPGRLIDHMKRGTIDLSHITTIVLDEADEMLDMGFIEYITTTRTETPFFSRSRAASIALCTMMPQAMTVRSLPSRTTAPLPSSYF